MFKDIKESQENKLTVGTKVHVGHGTRGGAGVFGKVVKIEDDYVYIKNDEGKTFKAPIENVTIEESVKTSFKEFLIK